MNYSHDKSWQAFEVILNSKLPVKEAWNTLIDFHENIKPNPIWNALKNLDLETEQTDLCNWLEQTISNSPMPENVKALWIGITKIWDEELSKELYVIYIIGSNQYDKNNIFWALDPTYEPVNNVGILEALNQIDEIIKDDPDQEFLDWLFPIAYCSFTLDEIIRTKLNKSIFLKTYNKIFVTTGFDDGDYANLSPIEK